MTEGEDVQTTERVLSEKEEKDIKDTFEELDKNGNGIIEASEFVVAMRKLGENPTDEEIETALNSMDRDNDDAISFDEFRKFFIDTPVKSQEERMQELAEAFKIFDRDNDGFIRRDELRGVLCKGPSKMSEEDVNEMFDLVDTNEDGKINIDEFTRNLLEIALDEGKE